MESHFWALIGQIPAYQTFFETHLEDFKEIHPDLYFANEALAQILGLPVQQTLAVSHITEFSTFCTSILARDSKGKIIHLRNLDFAFTDTMKKLIFEAILVKDGKQVARAPLIAGFYGVFTV